jgi:hypothetical protein
MSQINNFKSFLELLAEEIERLEKGVYATEDELIPDRELSDIAYMTKQLENSDTDNDSDWTPHEGSDSGSESTDSDFGVLDEF